MRPDPRGGLPNSLRESNTPARPPRDLRLGAPNRTRPSGFGILRNLTSPYASLRVLTGSYRFLQVLTGSYGFLRNLTSTNYRNICRHQRLPVSARQMRVFRVGDLGLRTAKMGTGSSRRSCGRVPAQRGGRHLSGFPEPGTRNPELGRRADSKSSVASGQLTSQLVYELSSCPSFAVQFSKSS